MRVVALVLLLAVAAVQDGVTTHWYYCSECDEVGAAERLSCESFEVPAIEWNDVDEDGIERHHSHDSSVTVCYYRCRMAHVSEDREYRRCWCSWSGEPVDLTDKIGCTETPR